MCVDFQDARKPANDEDNTHKFMPHTKRRTDDERTDDAVVVVHIEQPMLAPCEIYICAFLYVDYSFVRKIKRERRHMEPVWFYFIMVVR